VAFSTPGGLFVHNGESFKEVQQPWVKVNNSWQAARAIWVRQSGAWRLLSGTEPPNFSRVGGNFGRNPRPA
jgi:hypothetical protein